MWFLHDGTGQTPCCVAHGELAWLFMELDTGLDHIVQGLLVESETDSTEQCSTVPGAGFNGRTDGFTRVDSAQPVVDQ